MLFLFLHPILSFYPSRSQDGEQIASAEASGEASANEPPRSLLFFRIIFFVMYSDCTLYINFILFVLKVVGPVDPTACP